MLVTHAYRFALDPTPRQIGALLAHTGAARVAHNWCLGQVKANLGQREAERSYGVAEDDLTPVFCWSMYAMRKAWNRVKGEVAPWWAGNSKEAYATGIDNLARGLKNWSDSTKGQRKGPRMGFPRFKTKRRSTPSCSFTTGTIRLEDDRKHVTLPVLGTLKTHENTRKLHRRIANGTAKVTSATVKREAGRWYVSFCVQVQKQDRQPTRPDAVIGVDLGIRTLAVFSDGRPPADNPRHYDTARRKLARLSRTVSRRVGPDRRTGQRPSRRWQRANEQRNKVHHRVANLRLDGIHQLTTSLAHEYGTIVVEDLNVSGMLRNRKLARVVSDAGFGEIRRQLTYKTAWNGGRVVIADRWFPSSKTCSGCGAVKTKLPLRIRTYVCDECGLVLDRDENAALNLAALVTRQVAGSGPETRNGRGADQKTGPGPAGGCETSTSHRTSRGSDPTRTFVQ
ncbi:MAG: IS607 family element RNA-guided endonuclease TnpB [Umezawaea sp.]